jgi:predicted transglutaminase-like cysteine proteinase
MLEKLDRAFSHAKAIFQYTSDREAHGVEEVWPSDAEIAIAKLTGNLKDDCDGFAFLCRSLLLDAGIPSRLHIVITETNEGHMVCEAQGYVLDNRYPGVRMIQQLPYTWLIHSGYKKGDPWHKSIIKG